MKNRDAAVHPVAGLDQKSWYKHPVFTNRHKTNIDKDAPHVQTYFLALPTERAGSSNAPRTEHS